MSIRISICPISGSRSIPHSNSSWSIASPSIPSACGRPSPRSQAESVSVSTPRRSASSSCVKPSDSRRRFNALGLISPAPLSSRLSSMPCASASLLCRLRRSIRPPLQIVHPILQPALVGPDLHHVVFVLFAQISQFLDDRIELRPRLPGAVVGPGLDRGEPGVQIAEFAQDLVELLVRRQVRGVGVFVGHFVSTPFRPQRKPLVERLVN